MLTIFILLDKLAQLGSKTRAVDARHALHVTVVGANDFHNFKNNKVNHLDLSPLGRGRIPLVGGLGSGAERRRRRMHHSMHQSKRFQGPKQGGNSRAVKESLHKPRKRASKLAM